MTGKTLQGRYRIESLLGKGGMGAVYRAHDAVLDRDVALKLLSAGPADGEARARMLHEARAAAALNHPHIVSVYDTGEADGVPFVVMELVPGGSLAGRGPMPVPQLIEVGRQLCEALEHAHAHGVVHRDLKPENILIAHDGDPLVTKLTDLGVALSVRGTRITLEGAIVGTASYLAPEQALGQPVDGRTDLYALGVVLYELAIGRLPFTGDDALIVISQHLHAPVVPPRTYRPELPAGLEAVILRLMAKSPADRFASAGDVGEVLAALDSGGDGATDEPAADARVLELLARGRIVGRRPELQQLRQLWSRAMEGQGHLVLLSGEPGVGKTRLAREIVVMAQLNGAEVMHGGCYEYEATTPYLPFVEALRHWVHEQAPEVLRARLGPLAPELARLAPEIEAKLGPLPPSPALPPQEERLRLFDHVARLFQGLARERGLLLVLDDLHWADHGTLTLLQYLMRNLREERLLVLGAYREADLDRSHPLAAALVEWNRERLATRVALQRLPLEATSELLATLFGQTSVAADFAAALFRETEGNPFFVEEVVKSLIEQGQIYRTSGDWQRLAVAELVIPQSIRAAVSRRLDRLSEPCTRTLQTASALGKTFEFSELAAVAESGEDVLLDALDEAEAAQVLRAMEEGTYAFTHDKIREVLLDELNPIRRRRLHQRIGEGLERMLGDEAATRAQDLAYHFILSGDLARGLEYSMRAADHAERVFANEEALGFLNRARECAEALKRTDTQSEIHERMATVHQRKSAFAEAIQEYERAAAFAGSNTRRAGLKVRIGNVYTFTGDTRALPYLEGALRELDPARQANDLALATALIGRFHHYRGQHNTAVEFLERARQLAEPLDDPVTLTLIYAYFAGAYQHLTRIEESMAWARRAIALGERTGYLEAKRIGYEFLAEDSSLVGLWDDTLHFAALNREIGERLGSLFDMAWADYPRALGELATGRLREAEATTRGALVMTDRVGDQRLGCFHRSLLSRVLTELGDEAEALEQAETAIATADEVGQVVVRSGARQAMLSVMLRQGLLAEAVAVGDQSYEIMRGTQSAIHHLFVGTPRVEAYIRLGRLEDARKLLDELIAAARAAGSRYHEAMARGLEGAWLAARGDAAPARTAFDEAVATHEAMGSVLELGSTLRRRAALRRAEGDAKGAVADLGRARDIFATAGARPALAAVEAELRSVSKR
jgi:tetratricopeptide (TPR) repeat protein